MGPYPLSGAYLVPRQQLTAPKPAGISFALREGETVLNAKTGGLMKRRKPTRHAAKETTFADRLALKLGSKLLLGLVIVVVVLTIVQCSVEKPESPQWTTNLTVPVINRTYQMEELICRIDQDGIEMDTAGNITYSISEELDTVCLDADNLAIGDLSYSMFESLGIPPSPETPVPPAIFSFSQSIALARDERIDTAGLSTGSIEFVVANETNLEIVLSLELPDFQLASEPLTLSDSLGPHELDTIGVSLADYRLIPVDQTVPQLLSINAVATTPGTAPGERVEVTTLDGFRVDAGLTGLTFDFITGLFDGLQVSFDSISVGIDVPEGFDGIALPTCSFTLKIDNGIDMVGSLDLQLTGSNGKSLVFTEQIAARGALASATSSITRETDFLSPVSDTITAGGTVQLGDFVVGSVEIVAPLEMIISDTEIETDIESEKIDQEDIDLITDYVIEARFIFNVTSHLPLGTSVEILMGGDSATLFAEPELSIGPLVINAAPTDSITGLVSDTASTGWQELVLTNEDIRVLENDTLFIGQNLILLGSDGQRVKLTANDYLTITGRFEVEYHFDGDL